MEGRSAEPGAVEDHGRASGHGLDRFPSTAEGFVCYIPSFVEPSTVNLTKMYHKHIKVLELGWANPQQPTRWIPHKFQELTKRSVRYILVLTNTPIELHSIKIVAWFEMYRFKKVLYHLCRFLR